MNNKGVRGKCPLQSSKLGFEETITTDNEVQFLSFYEGIYVRNVHFSRQSSCVVILGSRLIPPTTFSFWSGSFHQQHWLFISVFIRLTAIERCGDPWLKADPSNYFVLLSRILPSTTLVVHICFYPFDGNRAVWWSLPLGWSLQLLCPADHHGRDHLWHGGHEAVHHCRLRPPPLHHHCGRGGGGLLAHGRAGQRRQVIILHFD